MIKMVIFFRRKAGMNSAAFREHWRTKHAALIVALPGIRRYVQNYPLESASLGGEPVFDAVAESSFDDTQAMKALARTPEYAAVLADEPNFIDGASMGSIITEERVLKDGAAPAGGVKRIGFVARQAQMPIDEFFRLWLEHGERCARSAALRRYAQCHVRRSIYDAGRTPAFDGAAMGWYDGVEALNAAADDKFGDPQRWRQLIASERVVA